MSEVDFILRRGEWRYFTNNLGDSLYDIQFLLTLPYDKINFYCESELKSYPSKIKDLLRIFDTDNKVNLIKPGIRIPEDSENKLYNIRGMSNERRRPNARLKLFADEKALSPNLNFLKNFNYNLDFSKTITWNRRPPSPSDKKNRFRFLSELPEEILERWPNYNFINLGARFDGQGSYDYLFDLDTSMWLLKKCAAYVGSDAGVTHLAITVKAVDDIYFYGENNEGKKSREMNSFKNSGINFLVE